MKTLIQLLICSFIATVPVLCSGVASAQETKDGNADTDNAQTEEKSEILVKATPWATVTVDKVLKGSTPLNIKVPAGMHKVELRFPPQNKIVAQTVTTKPGQKINLVCDMNAETDNCQKMTEDSETIDSAKKSEYTTDTPKESGNASAKRQIRQMPKIKDEPRHTDPPMQLPF